MLPTSNHTLTYPIASHFTHISPLNHFYYHDHSQPHTQHPTHCTATPFSKNKSCAPPNLETTHTWSNMHSKHSKHSHCILDTSHTPSESESITSTSHPTCIHLKWHTIPTVFNVFNHTCAIKYSWHVYQRQNVYFQCKIDSLYYMINFNHIRQKKVHQMHTISHHVMSHN